MVYLTVHLSALVVRHYKGTSETKKPIPPNKIQLGYCETMVLALSNLIFHFSILLFLFNLLIPTSSRGDQSKSNQPNDHVAMFVFGDSVFDAGNNNYINVSIIDKANYWPYGETFFNHSTGRFCDGRLIPDFIASHANLPFCAPYLQPGSQNYSNGASFAGGAAAVLVETNPGSLNLRIQLSFFKDVSSSLEEKLGDAEANKFLMNAVYLFSIGGNDISGFVDNYANATLLEMQEYTNVVIGNFTEVLKEMYNIGARKFAFLNVGPMGCLPFMRQESGLSGNCNEEALEMARLLNDALYEATKELESQLSGFKNSIFDYYNTLIDRIDYPWKYGFKDADVACCGTGTYHCGLGAYELCSNPSEFVFFDNAHPTEHVYSQVAELWWNGTPNLTKPYNMKQLFELKPTIKISTEDFTPLVEK